MPLFVEDPTQMLACIACLSGDRSRKCTHSDEERHFIAIRPAGRPKNANREVPVYQIRAPLGWAANFQEISPPAPTTSRSPEQPRRSRKIVKDPSKAGQTAPKAYPLAQIEEAVIMAVGSCKYPKTVTRGAGHGEKTPINFFSHARSYRDMQQSLDSLPTHAPLPAPSAPSAGPRRRRQSAVQPVTAPNPTPTSLSTSSSATPVISPSSQPAITTPDTENSSGDNIAPAATQAPPPQHQQGSGHQYQHLSSHEATRLFLNRSLDTPQGATMYDAEGNIDPAFLEDLRLLEPVMVYMATPEPQRGTAAQHATFMNTDAYPSEVNPDIFPMDDPDVSNYNIDPAFFDPP